MEQLLIPPRFLHQHMRRVCPTAHTCCCGPACYPPYSPNIQLLVNRLVSRVISRLLAEL